MAGHGEKLSRKQESAIAAMLTERTIGDAARKAKVSERALRNWLAQPAFRDAFRNARAELLTQTVGRLLDSTGKAVETLVKELDGEKGSDRIKAATAILDRALEGTQLLDVVDRVKELETLMQEIRGERQPPPQQTA
jgi:hypothetical protein